MIFLKLLFTFLKIGVFSFGGGYAMIPFFEKEIIANGWVAANDYSKIIAVAQVFPGPFAIDSSAYIGLKVGGLFGAIIASLALCLPSFIALIYITRFYVQFNANKYIQMLLSGVRPVVIGLLISSTYIIGIKPIFKTWESFSNSPFPLIKAIPLICIGFLILKRIKINPIIFIAIFAIIGVVLF